MIQSVILFLKIANLPYRKVLRWILLQGIAAAKGEYAFHNGSVGEGLKGDLKLKHLLTISTAN